jgi:hypothetical protein
MSKKEKDQGKYDLECEFMRDQLEADLVLLVVMDGKLGSGFSVTTTDQRYIDSIPDILEMMAKDIRASNKANKSG